MELKSLHILLGSSKVLCAPDHVEHPAVLEFGGRRDLSVGRHNGRGVRPCQPDRWVTQTQASVAAQPWVEVVAASQSVLLVLAGSASSAYKSVTTFQV